MPTRLVKAESGFTGPGRDQEVAVATRKIEAGAYSIDMKGGREKDGTIWRFGEGIYGRNAAWQVISQIGRSVQKRGGTVKREVVGERASERPHDARWFDSSN
jgi:hypothetical protein